MGRQPIVVERVIAAAPEAVFAAWGDAASLRAWMVPGPTMHGASVEADFRVGGSFRIVMHDRDRDYVHRGEYLDIVPTRRSRQLSGSPQSRAQGEKTTPSGISARQRNTLPLTRRCWRPAWTFERRRRCALDTSAPTAPGQAAGDWQAPVSQSRISSRQAFSTLGNSRLQSRESTAPFRGAAVAAPGPRWRKLHGSGSCSVAEA